MRHTCSEKDDDSVSASVVQSGLGAPVVSAKKRDGMDTTDDSSALVVYRLLVGLLRSEGAPAG